MPFKELNASVVVNDDGQITLKGETLFATITRANSRQLAHDVLGVQGFDSIRELLAKLTPADRVRLLAPWCTRCGDELPHECT